MIRRIAVRLQSLARSQDGTVAIQVAVTLATLLGMAGLATDVGLVLYRQRQMQAAADAAAYSGAMAAYSGHPANYLTEAEAVAGQNGFVNGVNTVTVSVNEAPKTPPAVNTYPANGSYVQVIISQPQSPVLAGVVYSLAGVVPSKAFNISAQAVAEVSSGVPACVLALQTSGTPMTLNGGTNLSAPKCVVASDGSIAVSGSASITAKAVHYNGSAPSITGGASISPTATKASTPDPLAGNAGIVAANARAVADESLTSPTIPAIPAITMPSEPGGPTVSFGYYPTTMTAGPCSGTLSGSTWTMTCTGGTINLGPMTVPGGLTVNFTSAANYNFSGSASSPAITNQGSLTFESGNFNFWGTVNNSGTNLSFGSGTFNFYTPSGVTASLAANNGTTTFGAGTFNFEGTVTSGGSSLTFGAGSFNFAQGLTTSGSSTTSVGVGSSGNTYDFGGTVTNGGSNLSLGSGTFNLAEGLHTLGGSTATFGAGTFYIGQESSSSPCTDGGYYSVCNLETNAGLTFDGPSTFVLTSGIYNGGGDDVTFGAGSTANSYAIGKSSNGYALNVGGGATTTFDDATGTNFQMVGNLTESGGSCITLPAATNHDINGTVNLMGGLTMGSGLYAVTGSFLVGASGGGDVWCSSVSANVGVSASNVAIAVAGSGAGANAFIIGAGFQHVTISAPTSGTYENVAIVGPLSGSTAGMSLNQGASNATVDGALYFPLGTIALDGGASIGNGAGQCLEIVANEVTLTGGTAMASTCSFGGSGGSTTPTLVE